MFIQCTYVQADLIVRFVYVYIYIYIFTNISMYMLQCYNVTTHVALST